jgi:hypothetical protein
LTRFRHRRAPSRVVWERPSWQTRSSCCSPKVTNTLSKVRQSSRKEPLTHPLPGAQSGAKAALSCILLLSNAPTRRTETDFRDISGSKKTCVISTPCCASAISMPRSNSIRTPWG